MNASGHVMEGGPPYRIVIEVGRDPVTGKRKRQQHTYRTKGEAKRALTEKLHRLNAGEYVEPSRVTLGEQLDLWLANTKATVRPSTYKSYANLVEHQLKPRLGETLLQQLATAQLNTTYAAMLSNGRRSKKAGPLSPRTVRFAHTVLRMALQDAVRSNLVHRNVADAARPPRKATPTMQVWSVEQLRTFLGKVEGDRLYAGYLLLAMTGMRRGEALGLRWQDVDVANGRVSIVQTLVATDYETRFSTPKTDRGRRTVALDRATLATLVEHRERQQVERAMWGDAYTDHGLVLAKENGEPLHPHGFSQSFRRHVKLAGLTAIRLHDLRHTYATLALQAGVHPKVVQERLGHSSIAITMDTYSHAIPALQESAAELIAAQVLAVAAA